MYYKLEWYEENTNHFQRVFQAKDVPTLWKAVHYMNQERKEKQWPVMMKMQITALEKYRGDYSVITGTYTKDELYEASLSEIKGEPLPAQYKDLAECADLFGVPLYTYLLLIYTYHWRCNLLHGNRATMLFCAYNDYEIAVLHTVNYFLDRFLNEAIW